MKFRSRMILMFLAVIFGSCSNEKYYYGYVCDGIDDSTIKNVEIISMPDSSLAFTNNKGYFEVMKTPGTASSLFFTKKGYCNREIFSVSVHSESLNYKFKGDTTFLFPIIDGVTQDKSTGRKLGYVEISDYFMNRIAVSDSIGRFSINNDLYFKIILKKEGYFTDTIELYNTKEGHIIPSQKIRNRNYSLIPTGKN